MVQLFTTLTKSSTQNLNQWFGDALKVVVNESITSDTANNITGEPGLYAEKIGQGFNTTGTATTYKHGNTLYIYFVNGGQTNGIPVH